MRQRLAGRLGQAAAEPFGVVRFGLAAVSLPLIAMALRLVGLQAVLGALPRPGHFPRRLTAEGVAGWKKAIDRAACRLPGGASCLEKSLFLACVLRLNGFPARVCIGVRMIERKLDAHAWVESDGIPVNESPRVTALFQCFADLRVRPSAVQ